MIKIQNDNNDKNIGDVFQISHFSGDSVKWKRAGRSSGIQVLTAGPCSKEFMTKAAE